MLSRCSPPGRGPPGRCSARPSADRRRPGRADGRTAGAFGPPWPRRRDGSPADRRGGCRQPDRPQNYTVPAPARGAKPRRPRQTSPAGRAARRPAHNRPDTRRGRSAGPTGLTDPSGRADPSARAEPRLPTRSAWPLVGHRPADTRTQRPAHLSKRRFTAERRRAAQARARPGRPTGRDTPAGGDPASALGRPNPARLAHSTPREHSSSPGERNPYKNGTRGAPADGPTTPRVSVPVKRSGGRRARLPVASARPYTPPRPTPQE